MPNFNEKMEQAFNKVANTVLENLQGTEEANINLHAEDSLFVRFNNNQIRQNTHVTQKNIDLLLQKDHRTSQVQFTITGNSEEDSKRALHWLKVARTECGLLPEDPYQVPMVNNGTSHQVFSGNLLPDEDVLTAITDSAQGSDLAGLYCAGPLISANKNSRGQSHWFANENFFMDYSLYLQEKAVKGVYAGSEWNQEQYSINIAQSKNQLNLMNRPPLKIPPGAYRTYFAPGAVAELASMFSWGAFSFNGLKQGSCAFQKLAQKEKTLSPLLNIRENFGMGLTHRFNSLGELAPEKLDLITNGELQSLLISSRSAKEYGVQGNYADPSESPRALEIQAGNLKKEHILKELGTGLYLSNLHYLNWSDRTNARITGMTRYACFWVERGEIVRPIADLRFDESLFEALGTQLMGVTDFQEVDPMISTYDRRGFGGKKIPGMLINDFKFTL